MQMLINIIPAIIILTFLVFAFPNGKVLDQNKTTQAKAKKLNKIPIICGAYDANESSLSGLAINTAILIKFSK